MVLENQQLGVKNVAFLTPNCLRGVRGLSSLTFEIKQGLSFAEPLFCVGLYYSHSIVEGGFEEMS